jgi:hypothetical protein
MKLSTLVIVLLVLALGGAAYMYFSPSYGGGTITNITNPFWFKNTVKVGANGTAVSGVIATTCDATVYASLGATSTAKFDCPVTGALTTAKAVSFGSLATAQTGNYGNLIIWGGRASSTAGYVSGFITNLTGQATSSYALATTSIPVLIVQ